jgi:hypothetical protein
VLASLGAFWSSLPSLTAKCDPYGGGLTRQAAGAGRNRRQRAARGCGLRALLHSSRSAAAHTRGLVCGRSFASRAPPQRVAMLLAWPNT